MILTASQIPASGFLRKTPPLPWIGCLLPPKENNRTQRGIPRRNGKAWWKNFPPLFFPIFKSTKQGTSVWFYVGGSSKMTDSHLEVPSVQPVPVSVLSPPDAVPVHMAPEMSPSPWGKLSFWWREVLGCLVGRVIFLKRTANVTWVLRQSGC